MVDHNGKQAAIRAGYSPRSAHVQASRMLSKGNVKERLAELEQEAKERTALSAEMVRESFRRILCFNPKLLLRSDGSLVPLQELPDEVADCIKSVECNVKVVVTGDGENKTVTTIPVWRYTFYSKDAARDMAARITGLIKDPKLVVDMNPLRELMERIGDKGSGLTYNPLPSRRHS
jgi:phage terminase small subunit